MEVKNKPRRAWLIHIFFSSSFIFVAQNMMLYIQQASSHKDIKINIESKKNKT